VSTPYYQDDLVTLWHGDLREHTSWLTAKVLFTDPPYGRAWRQGGGKPRPGLSVHDALGRAHPGIDGDTDTHIRDTILAMWGTTRPAAIFGDLLIDRPPGTKQALIYGKPLDAGKRGTFAGFARDAEAIWLIGPWPAGIGGQTSILHTRARVVGTPYGLAARYGHPHAKPIDVCETIIEHIPPELTGPIADPAAGSGSILVAARNLGHPAIGVELEERYCQRAAERLSVPLLIDGPIGDTTA
jgi:site-specific DNA-methyltransferase (adenine-specific)